MKTRKERAAEFMAKLNELDVNKLQVACYVRQNRFSDLNSIEMLIAELKNEYSEHDDSWVIDDVASEYNTIAGMSEHNLQVWANYRRHGNKNAPVANLNGEFIDVALANIVVCLDGNYYTISPYGVNIENGETSMPISHMAKLQMIASHLNEIKSIVE